MITDRFASIRRKELDFVFKKQSIIRIWRKVVKDQLRRVDIKDLYDYYDFNYNIEERALAIRTDILNGNFRCSLPLIYRIEKKYGICRHIVIPQPTDALVLQIITEILSAEILKKQPSKNAYYSQDKHNTFKPHQIQDEYGLTWQELWKKLQTNIYEFSIHKELLIVTDLSNYYDSIDIIQLRKVISNHVDDKEVLLDLLFSIIQEISWTPDYLPYSGRGLPTSNLEGIRLLAHGFLFELDSILKEKSNNSFTRWMDDIVIGADTLKEAIETISSASDILKSRGLALNIAKTNIYSAKEGKYHFQIDENKYLDGINYKEKDKKKITVIINDLHTSFKKHLSDRKPKYWEKITKRYITAFSRFKSRKLLPLVSKMYNEIPGVRMNLLYYLHSLGYNIKTSSCILSIIRQLDVHDDISLFQICKLITDWEISDNEISNNFLNQIESELFIVSKRRKVPFDFYCILWFKAKYRHPENIQDFITTYENIWKADPFLRRQVTSLMTRIFITDRSKAISFLTSQMLSGITESIGLASQIIQFSKFEFIPTKLRMYLFPKTAQKPYPLAKFLILSNILTSSKIRKDPATAALVKEHIFDPFYILWLKSQYDIK